MNRFAAMFVFVSTAIAALILVSFNGMGMRSAVAQTFGGAGLHFPFVGVYWFGADVKGPQFLEWPATESADGSDLASTDNLVKQFNAAPTMGVANKLYTYGLDFSRPASGNAVPVPPQLAHWRIYFVDGQFKTHEAQPMKFAPVSGFDQQVYSIDLTPAEAGAYKMIVLELPNGDAAFGHYYFKTNPAPAAQ
jgi:hypothetical protein